MKEVCVHCGRVHGVQPVLSCERGFYTVVSCVRDQWSESLMQPRGDSFPPALGSRWDREGRGKGRITIDRYNEIRIEYDDGSATTYGGAVGFYGQHKLAESLTEPWHSEVGVKAEEEPLDEVTVCFRLSGQEYAELKELAEEEDRTVALEARWLVRLNLRHRVENRKP